MSSWDVRREREGESLFADLSTEELRDLYSNQQIGPMDWARPDPTHSWRQMVTWDEVADITRAQRRRRIPQGVGEKEMDDRKNWSPVVILAWALYAASFFLPAADIGWDSTSGMTGSGTCVAGGIVLCSAVLATVAACFTFPPAALLPGGCLVVNLLFVLHRKMPKWLLVLATVAAWLPPIFLPGVCVGFFAWAAAITLVSYEACVS